ncbi:MAG: hypothetical protein R3324_13455, partial [Halobacteriales archaeon]|nr:hypothetical protein [Halobacteriales archaeon]
MAIGIAAGAHGQQLTEELLEAFSFRAIGPSATGGRIIDIDVDPSHPATVYAAAASGGLWKTVNHGTTWDCVFEDQGTISIGDIAVDPSNPQTVWVGTGEANNQRSSYFGDGIYKSTDGGETWTNMGLEKTEHIGRIVVHPTDSNTVYVAAVGALYKHNPERGVYKTTDGGDTWEKVEGGGLPETMLGKMNVAFAPSYPRVMYLMVEAAAPEGSAEDNLNGLYRSDDGGETWRRMNDFNTRPFYYSEVVVDPADPDRVYFSSLRFSEDGGETTRDMARAVHVDFHAIWVDPNDPERIVLGNDGGIVVSFDRGGNYWFPNVIPLGQFYNVSYGMEVPYTVCGGLQDNYTWCGPSRKADEDITNHDWFRVSGGDGFVTQQDPRYPELVYSESQGGNMGRSNLETGERTSFERPDWENVYREYQDSIALLWPDVTEPMPEEHRSRIEGLQ